MRAHLIISLAALFAALATCSPRRTLADWTIMVYLNGDNGLEGYAVKDFQEMAAVGSTTAVNVIVQFDRQRETHLTDPDWSQTLRFRVTKDMPPIPARSFADLGEQDMADGKTVAEFVRTTRNAFPAKHYALVLWGHGGGYRLSFDRDDEAAVMFRETARKKREQRDNFVEFGITPWSFKAGTGDGSTDSDDNILYNRELADALLPLLKDQPLDLFLFDECVMGMVENAYALRHVSRIMVASEEVIPSTGFNHTKWLRELVRRPQMSPEELSRVLLRSYRDSYQSVYPLLTMSATDLRRIEPLKDAISGLANALRNNLAENCEVLRDARGACVAYGGGGECLNGCFNHVDLQRLCEEIGKRTRTPAVRRAAQAVIAAEHAAILANEAGDFTRKNLGSNGLAIYFPADGNSYCADTFNECGYERYNEHYPLEFVRDSTWTDLLHDYFRSVPDAAGRYDPNEPCTSAFTGCWN